jgi:hypothetical protein
VSVRVALSSLCHQNEYINAQEKRLNLQDFKGFKEASHLEFCYFYAKIAFLPTFRAKYEFRKKFSPISAAKPKFQENFIPISRTELKVQKVFLPIPVTGNTFSHKTDVVLKDASKANVYVLLESEENHGEFIRTQNAVIAKYALKHNHHRHHGGNGGVGAENLQPFSPNQQGAIMKTSEPGFSGLPACGCSPAKMPSVWVLKDLQEFFQLQTTEVTI